MIKLLRDYWRLNNLEGPYGKYRVMLMKKWFRTIIENMVPDALMIRLHISKFNSKLSIDSYEKLLKMNK